MTEHNIPLTASEMGFLWTQYMNDTLAICVMKYFKNICEDKEILPLIENSLSIAENDINMITEIFKTDNVAIPVGFTDEDVNVNAPRLFSDVFILMYIQKLEIIAMASIGIAIGVSARSDVSEFFRNLLVSVSELHDKARKVMLSKGVYVRPPQIPTPDKVDYVDKQGFLFDFLGSHKRPLTAIEITHLYINIQTNAMGKALMTGFAQVCKGEDVKQFFMEEKGISNKHINKFSSTLINGDLPAPMSWDAHVLDSTVAPFSDKLMMFHTTTLIAAGIGNYGTAAGTCERMDLNALYTRLSAEIALYAEDGANLMIKHAWLEEPPKAADHKALVKKSMS
ncbi:DUF3231 family protein [Heyndrickxia sporothermodurans]|uniref:DUF3231 family protein n=2 Tax=Heyndrickxia sporothermodurans TaxID=46224 RepID=A0AB37HAA3_9BACI|nr:DUF3231 family protein [Heyndrickxia sporothermodurans]MBL5767878.1 DUF3231 family protein [Heyndrickxia sporothermodurans]MBL5771478.1 DUF3231 family protein [Heyndrickxia sporothermodurans]MBL5775151.1 DUF3231 family protein [Heyndrickxia sporothermodurans]MBL5778582.1 DUF3231 family protein [Heyndrickxia sporothermodurans]MBL5782169.1 DUF3231 family protein [Heyndrickxia sporothermodurans]